MKKLLSEYRYFLAILVFDLVVLIIDRNLGGQILNRTVSGFAEMLGVLPPIFVLLGLLDVWVPRETMIRYVGEESGVTGALLSLVLGAAAAGPLYTAFPVVAMMARKGAGFLNLLILLGAWSTLKIPQLLFEISALGLNFAIIRWAINVVGIFLMAALINRLLSREEKMRIMASVPEPRR